MSFETNEKKPVVEFIADETKRATGLYGPKTILSDLTEIAKMFDPNSVHDDGETKGGIREENLSEELKNAFSVLENQTHTHEYDAEPFENSEGLVKSGKLFEFFKKYASLEYLKRNYYNRDDIDDYLSICDEELENADGKIEDLDKKTAKINSDLPLTLKYDAGVIDVLYGSNDTSSPVRMAVIGVQDAEGNVIHYTYAKKDELESLKTETAELKTEIENTAEVNEKLENDIEKLEYYRTTNIEISPVNWFKYDENTLTRVTQYNYNKDLVIPYIFTSIGEQAVSGLANLKGIVLPNSIVSIGRYAFRNNPNLTRINIPDGVTTIGAEAFKNCTGLTSITIPESVTSLGDNVFDGCTGLTCVTILSNKFEVSDNTFLGVGQDAVFYIEQGTDVEEKLKLLGCNYKYIKVNAETYATKEELENYVKKDDYSGINSLAYFFADNLNNGLFGAITTSGALMCDYIFKNNSMAEITVDLSNCVSMIGGFLNSTVEKVTFTNNTSKLQKANNLFRGCTKLAEVSGLDLTNCGSVKYLFMNCESLKKATIETNTTDLSYCFYGCKALEKIEIAVPNLQVTTGMFTGCDSLNAITIEKEFDLTSLFEALPTVEDGKVLILSTFYNNVPEETKAIAENKGWTISE